MMIDKLIHEMKAEEVEQQEEAFEGVQIVL